MTIYPAKEKNGNIDWTFYQNIHFSTGALNSQFILRLLLMGQASEKWNFTSDLASTLVNFNETSSLIRSLGWSLICITVLIMGCELCYQRCGYIHITSLKRS